MSNENFEKQHTDNKSDIVTELPDHVFYVGASLHQHVQVCLSVWQNKSCDAAIYQWRIRVAARGHLSPADGPEASGLPSDAPHISDPDSTLHACHRNTRPSSWELCPLCEH